MSLPDYQQIFDIYQRSKEALDYALPATEAQQLEQRLASKSQQLHPVIMVYGVYNAGKSTLLNALMGRADAVMADRPMTDSVTGYPWQGYTLYDTPGIDAPLAHQAVTEQQLHNADVVLFVVASGGVIEEISTWQALMALVEKERRVVLIVNNKSGLKADSADYLHIVDQLRQRLQQAAAETQIENIVSKVSIHLVNARSALKGRLENKTPLVEASGIVSLEQHLSAFLQETNQHSILQTCYGDLRRATESALLVLSSQNPEGGDDNLVKARSLIEGERSRLGMQLNDRLTSSVQKSKRNLAREIDELMAGCRTQAQFEEALGCAIDRICEQIHAEQQAVLDEELPKTQSRLKDIGENLYLAEMRRGGTNAALDVSLPSEEESSIWKQGMQQALDHSNKLNVQSLAEAGAKKGLELGKDLLPELFKGIGKKTIERWASVAGRYAGPAMAVGLGAWNIYQAIAENEKLKQAHMRRRQAAEDTAGTLTDGLKRSWQGINREVLTEIFEPLDALLLAKQEAQALQLDSIAAFQLHLQQTLITLRDPL